MKHFRMYSTGIIISLFLCPDQAQSQMTDTSKVSEINHLGLSQIILPGAMITYGIVSLVSDQLRQVDFNIQHSFIGSQSSKIDDYLIYAPLALDLGFTAGGIKSRHNVRDKAFLYLLSTALNAVMVYPVKSLTSRQRPDLSNTNSFPSGHTSNAFVGAEYFWQEHKHHSIWIASAGYLMAGTTGYFRIKNNKHWFSDVVAGAGIGIISTKLIYAIYPRISEKIFRKKANFVILPFNFDVGYGLSFHYLMR